MRGAELGINEAVRVYVAYQHQYYAANKARFARRMLYGLAVGLNEWSLLSAETPDGILNLTGYSAKGSLFMHAWDPVGDDGFSDVYSQVCATPTGMAAMFESPATAADMPLLVTPRDVMQLRRHFADSPATANRTISVLRQVMDYALEQELIDANPCVGIKRVPQQARTRRIERSEFAAIQAHAAKQLKHMLNVLKNLKKLHL